MMREIFLGKPIHWLVLAIVLGVLWWMGDTFLHTRNFNLFVIILLLSSTAAVIALRITTRPEERVTREPFHDE